MITKEYLQQELAKRIGGYKPGVATTTDNIIAEMKSILVLVDALQDRVKDYDDALKRAKDFKNGTVQFALEPGESIVHYIFPELREIEDEEIRQQLLWLCGQWEHNPEERTIPADIDNIRKIRNWLEKQKEQKPTSFNEPYNPDEYEVVMEGNATSLKRKEQKPAVSREEILHQLFQNGSITLSDYLYLTEGQKLAWGEEDENRFRNLIYLVEHSNEGKGTKEGFVKFINRLKSLHPSWKPSEEQIDALKELIDDANRAGWVTPGATELYEQLKKL